MESKAVELAKQLFDGPRAGAESLAPGLNRFFAEVGAMVEQKVDQGCSEVANAFLHQSDAFVLYGPGQNANLWGPGHDQQLEQGQEQIHDHDLSRER